jgi:hypothetical protein
VGQPAFLPGGLQVRDDPLLAENLPEGHGPGGRRRGWRGSGLIFLRGRHICFSYPIYSAWEQLKD